MFILVNILTLHTPSTSLFFLINSILTRIISIFFFLNDTAPTEIYTLPLHDALPILIDSGGGKISAAPRPITNRTADNAVGVSTSPPTAEAVPNTASPDSSAPLRPKRSPRLPPASTSAANVRPYAATTHCSSLIVAPSSRTSDGNATFTIVVSRL